MILNFLHRGPFFNSHLLSLFWLCHAVMSAVILVIDTFYAVVCLYYPNGLLNSLN